MILKGRYWDISVGTMRISSSAVKAGERPLTLTFEVSKSLDREPNSATVKICNLSKSRRERLEQEDEPALSIVAGYQDMGSYDQIFGGDTSDIYSSRDGADIWTSVEAKDGGASYRTARLAVSFPPGTPLVSVVTAISGAMGVGVGNSAAIAATAVLDSGSSVFTNGIAIEGPAWRSLDTICRSASLRWSVQNGALQLRGQRQPAEVSTILLSPGTGLIGSPARSARDPRSGDITVTATALIVPGLYPGKVIVLSSDTVTGPWMIHGIKYTGSTTGSDWYAELTLKDYDIA